MAVVDVLFRCSKLLQILKFLIADPNKMFRCNAGSYNDFEFWSSIFAQLTFDFSNIELGKFSCYKMISLLNKFSLFTTLRFQLVTHSINIFSQKNIIRNRLPEFMFLALEEETRLLLGTVKIFRNSYGE